MKLTDWFKAFQPGEQMYWKDAFASQQAEMLGLASSLPLLQPADVPSTHTSKSITLPVLHLRLEGVDVYLRENFNDINVCFICEKAPQLEPSQIYGTGRDWTWYIAEIDRARNYSWAGWTDEQMDDPECLHVVDQRETHKGIKWSKSKEEKLRWVNRLTDPAWYTHDWTHGEVIVEGTMGPDCTLYHAGYPFMEGISQIVPPEASLCYKPGRAMFTVVTDIDWVDVQDIIKTVTQSKDVI